MSLDLPDGRETLAHMPIRDWLAGLAMQGLLSSDIEWDQSSRLIAKCAYEQADAMLAERAKVADSRLDTKPTE
jgi:hypothetical protein